MVNLRSRLDPLPSLCLSTGTSSFTTNPPTALPLARLASSTKLWLSSSSSGLSEISSSFSYQSQLSFGSSSTSSVSSPAIPVLVGPSSSSSVSTPVLLAVLVDEHAIPVRSRRADMSPLPKPFLAHRFPTTTLSTWRVLDSDQLSGRVSLGGCRSFWVVLSTAAVTSVTCC